MTALALEIRDTIVEPRTLAIWYLAQAGFCIKTSMGTRVVIDAYLSDYCGREFGFKRMIPAVIAPDDLRADVLISTHSHGDHLDPDALEAFAAHPATQFIGSADCESVYVERGVAPDRYTLLRPGDETVIRDVAVRATYADHGELCPEAIGVTIAAEGLRIYNVGDSALRPEEMLRTVEGPVDVMIAPINGAFGNLDAFEACQLGARVRPRLLIAAHFWMFIEHGGDPGRFLEEARNLPAGIEALVMAPGEQRVVRAEES
ncbi:MAG TPA: MBL fold metallo-hydrolase [Armatimonadota bacterium]|nr:MBL fold metallo-hydrolase [Armatimonadota bacterium]HQK95524.1 MBL fold metallo-hydrolase [Armatimonadota bacterium]